MLQGFLPGGIQPGGGLALAFARLQRRLSDILGRPVDLVTPDALHKAMKRRILQ